MTRTVSSFARRVRADQSDDLARLDGERDAVECLGVAIEGVDVLEAQHRAVFGRCPGHRPPLAARLRGHGRRSNFRSASSRRFQNSRSIGHVGQAARTAS